MRHIKVTLPGILFGLTTSIIFKSSLTSVEGPTFIPIGFSMPLINSI